MGGNGNGNGYPKQGSINAFFYRVFGGIYDPSPVISSQYDETHNALKRYVLVLGRHPDDPEIRESARKSLEKHMAGLGLYSEGELRELESTKPPERGFYVPKKERKRADPRKSNGHRLTGVYPTDGKK